MKNTVEFYGKEVTIGMAVMVDQKLVRKKRFRPQSEDGSGLPGPIMNVWVAQKIEPKQVYVVGVRNLKNGKIYYRGEYEQPAFVCTEQVPALMVTDGLRSKPFFVLDFYSVSKP